MAEVNREQIEQLVRNPRESLATEIKTWISPTEPAGQAKIIKGTIALRNRGGGYLIIGFDDKTLQADSTGMPADVRATFHVDVIQALVSKFASHPFEIAVELVERDGVVHPVIAVPAGVRTPVVTKAQLMGEGGKVWVERDAAFVRTLNSNNTVSTAKAQAKDWDEVCEICFNNREADIGRFFRRHLAGIDPSALRGFSEALSGNSPAQPTLPDRLKTLLDDGKARYEEAVKEREVKLPPHGSWEVALIIDGEFAPQTDLKAFANLLAGSNPQFTGWPVWPDSQGFADQESRPHVINGGWEALIILMDPSFFNHIDFLREDPKGLFYSYRALEDDISSSRNAPKPMACLDGILPVLHVAEAIAVGLAFVSALKVADGAKLEFMFRWSGLKNRTLTSWVNPGRYISARKTKQDVAMSTVTVPAETPASAIADYVKTAVRPLYEIFDGFDFPGAVVDDLTQKLLERRL